MTNKKQQLYFLTIIFLIASVIMFFIFEPFIYIFILTAIFAVLIYPIYKTILRLTRNRASLSAFITILITIPFVILPIIFIGIQIFQEIQQIYFSLLVPGASDNILDIVNIFFADIERLFPYINIASIDMYQYTREMSYLVLERVGAIFYNIAYFLMSILIFLFTLFFLLRDGSKIKKYFTKISPLDSADHNLIFNKLTTAINSVFKGNLLVALLQGSLASIGFIIFGISNPILWGLMTAISSFVPALGTATVLTPAIIFLFLSGEIFASIGLLIWAVCIVGLVDNVFRPMFIGEGLSLHPLLIFFAVLGGIALFGPLGLIFGPLALSLFVVLLDIYSTFINNVA